MSKHQAEAGAPKTTGAAASGDAKSGPIVILDANDGTPLIIVPTERPGTPAETRPMGGHSAPQPQSK